MTEIRISSYDNLEKIVNYFVIFLIIEYTVSFHWASLPLSLYLVVELHMPIFGELVLYVIGFFFSL